MSTYLQLAQQLRQEAIGPGSSALPSATTSQTGQLKEFVDWINRAWVDIQNLHENWRWMRRQVTLAGSVSDNTFNPADFTDVTDSAAVSAFGRWLPDYGNWTCYLTSTGQSNESDLFYMDFDDWRYLYDRGAGASLTGRPVHFTVTPSNQVRVGPIPDAAHTFRGWYQMAATELSGDGDTPEMPSQYHLAIVWRALMIYAEDRSAPDKYAKGNNNYSPLLAALELNQLPRFYAGAPMVT